MKKQTTSTILDDNGKPLTKTKAKQILAARFLDEALLAHESGVEQWSLHMGALVDDTDDELTVGDLITLIRS